VKRNLMQPKKRTLATLVKKLDPSANVVTRSLFLAGLLVLGTSAMAFAQTGIPIMDGILDFIQQYKTGLAMLGVAIAGAGMLTRLFAPDWSRDHKSAFISMIAGGVVLSMVSQIASLIVGS
jgi:hypothetical protein